MYYFIFSPTDYESLELQVLTNLRCLLVPRTGLCNKLVVTKSPYKGTWNNNNNGTVYLFSSDEIDYRHFCKARKEFNATVIN